MTQANHYDCIVSLLVRLGKTPDDIAERLRQLGIKGWRNSYRRNPLSEYLMTIVPQSIFSENRQDIGIAINFGHRLDRYILGISISNDEYHYEGNATYYQLKPACGSLVAFIRAFNKGSYPFLHSKSYY
jgi:hypothetical protein